MRITVLVGGVGGARFLLGARALLAGADHEVTAVVNVGDDVWMHGVRICPDLDTCMYTLGGGIDTERGWGQVGETWAAKDALAAYGAQPDWFGLGDKDLATHLVRTRLLRDGVPLSAVTRALCERWAPGVTLLPVSDDECETHVVVDDPTTDPPGQRRAIHFQEWWVRHRAQVPTHSFVQPRAARAGLGPGVAEAVAGADAVLLAPSNPVVSIGAMLAVPGLRSALRRTTAPVVGVSPIVGGRALRGMADECLTVLGLDTSAQTVGRMYGARSDAGLLDGWLVAEDDAAADVPGVAVRGVPLLMSDPATTAEMVRAALDLGGVDTSALPAAPVPA